MIALRDFLSPVKKHQAVVRNSEQGEKLRSFNIRCENERSVRPHKNIISRRKTIIERPFEKYMW
jgi:hypothetical protein